MITAVTVPTSARLLAVASPRESPPGEQNTKRSFANSSGRNQMFSEAFIMAVSKALSCEKLMSTLMAMIVDNRAESISGYVYSRS